MLDVLGLFSIITIMKLYIFPGLGETKENYEWLMKEVSDRYLIEFIDLDFKNKTFSDLINKKLDYESVVFGFSIGALIAYKNKSKVKKGIYCSISNIMGDDVIGKEKYIEDIFNKKWLNELKNESYGEPLADEYIIFCGENELDDTTKNMKNLEIIKDTGHILNGSYKESILEHL